MRMDQFVLVVQPFFIDTQHLVAGLIRLIQFSLHFSDPLAVVDDGYIPTE